MGAGGWLGAACHHGICYGLKWLIRQEGARDHVDIIRSMAHQPNFLVVDFANQVAAHGNKRYSGMFSPFAGRVVQDTPENVQLAKENGISVDMPWVTDALRGQPPGNPATDSNQRTPHPLSGSNRYLCLFDTLHEENSSNDSDLLRRTRCVKQIEGIFCTEAMEQLNNVMNRNNYFINQMSPVNAIFMQRLAMELSNREKNRRTLIQQQKQAKYIILFFNAPRIIGLSPPEKKTPGSNLFLGVKSKRKHLL